MLLIRYMKKRASLRSYLTIVCCMFFLILVNLALLINTKNSISYRVDVVHLLVMAVLSLHNQAFYLIPVTTALILIMCPRIKAQELYWMFISKDIHRFYVFEAVIVVIIYVLCAFIGTGIFFFLYRQLTFFDFSNSIIGLCFFVLHILGMLIACLILEMLMVFFNKVKAYLVFMLFIYTDIYLLSKFNISLLIGNGLTMDTNSFDAVIAVKSILIYYVYLYLINKYSYSTTRRWLNL